MLLFVLVLSVVLIFAACGNNEPNEVPNTGGEVATPTPEPTPEPEPVDTTQTEPIKEGIPYSFEQFTLAMQPGSMQSSWDVFFSAESTGDKTYTPTEVTVVLPEGKEHNGRRSRVTRYDFGVKDGYVVPAEHNTLTVEQIENGAGVDLAGLRDGSIAGQMLIFQDKNGKLKTWALLYADENNAVQAHFMIVPGNGIVDEPYIDWIYRGEKGEVQKGHPDFTE